MEGGDITIQGLAHPSNFQIGKIPLGPFSSSREGSQAILEATLAMISSGEIDAYSPLDVYLLHRFRLNIIDSLWKDVSPDT